MQSSFNKKVYIIVGEESGENIAVDIISKLKKTTNLDLRGIGGSRLEKLGFKSIFPFTELSIMGLIEIIPKIPKLLFYINKTVKDILSGIRSACTYVGANKLKTLSKCTTFVRVHNTHNTIFGNE